MAEAIFLDYFNLLRKKALYFDVWNVKNYNIKYSNIFFTKILLTAKINPPFPYPGTMM